MAVNEVITRLKSQLLTSGLSQKDQPLFQIINQLIDFVGKNADNLNVFTGGGGGGGGGGLANADYITHENNIATLPNSRQLIVGPGLSVNKTGSKFILSATGLPIREIREEPETSIPLPGPRGLQGLIGPQGPPGMDAECCECSEKSLFGDFSGIQQLSPFYSFGTWTPLISGTGGSSGQTYSQQLGQYTRIGRLIIAWFNVGLSNKGTITGDVIIDGYPFSSKSGSPTIFMPAHWENTATNWVNLFILMVATEDFTRIRGTAAASTTADTALVTADIANNTAFRGTIIYET